MTPEVEAHLDQLGWQTVKLRYPVEASWIDFAISPTGGNLTENKQQARSAAKSIRDLTVQILNLAKDLDNLNGPQRTVVNLGSAKSSEERDRARDFVSEAGQGLLRLEEGLYDLIWQLESDGGIPRRGWPKNIAARKVCKAVAITYYLSRHKLPSIGKLENGKGMSGEYGKVCEAILAELGITHSDVFSACKDAVENLKNRFENQLEGVRLHSTNPRGRNRALSMYSSLWASKDDWE